MAVNINEEVREIIEDVMLLLQAIPQGGVGDEGATLEEIHRAEHNNDEIGDDSTRHIVQKAWRMLQELLP